MILDRISSPADLRQLDQGELEELATEIRSFIVDAVSKTGGHLGSNLGVVELTLALHRVFDSPRDIILWDTGHQAYVHKLVTGRRSQFSRLKQEGGLSGYPSRAESEHDWVENSHASAILSYAHGLATANELEEELREGDHRDNGTDGGSDRHPRRIVAVVGDGALTGGMTYEALNNLGHSGRRVVTILNDNGRSYSPTVSHLSESLTRLRLNPSYVQARGKIKQLLKELPIGGGLAYSSILGLTSALREVIEPHVFFESLGVRYTGPLDGHDIAGMEQALGNAAEWEGPIVVHVLTHKGRGYAPAEDDDVQRLHDLKVTGTARPTTEGAAPRQYTDAFTKAMVDIGERRPEMVAITAAMAGPTGLLPFRARFPERCFDVGIAEQHAVTAAAGMAMGGLRPVVAVYSTFFTRAFDQANLDVGLHGLPVVFVLDRAGITGDDGPSHHGVLDLVLTLSIPGMTVFAPSSFEEVPVMLEEALTLPGPSAIRFPKTPAPAARDLVVGSGLSARKVREGEGSVCLLAVGKMLTAAEDAAEELAGEGIAATVWDARVVKPADRCMLDDAARHRLVVTVEDGLRVGGAGAFFADALAGLGPVGPTPPVVVLGIPTRFIPQAKPASILSKLGLDGPGVAASVRQALQGATTAPRLADLATEPD
jgi:1-deoxy-D-xylulose-5-phosphate synthase